MSIFAFLLLKTMRRNALVIITHRFTTHASGDTRNIQPWTKFEEGSVQAIIIFETEKKSSQIYKLLTGFTEGNGERLLLKYYFMKCFTF